MIQLTVVEQRQDGPTGTVTQETLVNPDMIRYVIPADQHDDFAPPEGVNSYVEFPSNGDGSNDSLGVTQTPREIRNRILRWRATLAYAEEQGKCIVSEDRIRFLFGTKR